MKTTIITLAAFIAIWLTACNKPINLPQYPNVPATEMEYIHWENAEVGYGKNALVADINKDGRYDLIFGVQLVGDPIAKVDKLQFMVTANYHSFLASNQAEETPIFNYMNSIPMNNSFKGYTWYNASGINLFEKITTIQNTHYWQGTWKNATKKYLGFYLYLQQKRYYGWVELSANTTKETLQIHRAGISKKPEQPVIAGK